MVFVLQIFMEVKGSEKSNVAYFRVEEYSPQKPLILLGTRREGKGDCHRSQLVKIIVKSGEGTQRFQGEGRQAKSSSATR